MTSDQIRHDIDALAQPLGLEVDWGREDGYTWLTLAGDTITPERYQEFSQAIADISGVKFYFHSIRVGSLEGALDWDMHTGHEYTTELDCDIAEYGTLFKPNPNTPQPRAPGL